MRPLWFEFPEDAACFATEDQFRWGPALLVAPVVEEGASKRVVYLPPSSAWYDPATGELPFHCSGGDRFKRPILPAKKIRLMWI